MKDGGNKTGLLLVPDPTNAAVLTAPVFHIYRVYYQGLNFVLVVLVPAVRTPFTCPVRRRRDGLGSPPYCRKSETPANRGTVAHTLRLWQELHPD